MNIVEITRLKYPGEIEKGNINFRQPADKILIGHWAVEGVPKPNEDDILAEAENYRFQYETNLAEQKRKAEYPSESEMIEAMWDHVVNSDSTKMYACANKKAAVDIKHPKPEVK